MTTRRFRFWNDLCRPYWQGPTRWSGTAALIIVVAASSSVVWLQTLTATWGKNFYDATVARDGPQLLELTLLGVGYAVMTMAVLAAGSYLGQWIEIRWRETLSRSYIARWLSGNKFYAIEMRQSVDNVDQRIEADAYFFISTALYLIGSLVSGLLGMVTFTLLLWDKAGPLEFTLDGRDYVIPGYLAWVAWGWALMHTGLVHWAGRRLVAVGMEQARLQADFRFGMTQVRESAEQIAMYGGAAVEQRRALHVFAAIKSNWRRYMNVTLRQNATNSVLVNLLPMVPLVALTPALLSGRLDYGDSIEIGMLYASLTTALLWIPNTYTQLAAWAASIKRLTGLARVLDEPGQCGLAPKDIDGEQLRVADLRLTTPEGRPLTQAISLTLEPGERCLVRGPSGVGKSTLLRAIAGIWQHGDGTIERPAKARTFFVPQKPYVPEGSLKEALTYPVPASSADDATCQQLLRDCDLAGLAPRLHQRAAWWRELSPGEQQRLAFVRVLLSRPDLLFLDESTSALDEETEARLYGLLIERLPRCTIASVAHRSTLLPFHTCQIHLQSAPKP